MDSSGTVRAGFYTRTSGKPMHALRSILEAINDAAERYGSGFNIIGADLIVDEITAHAADPTQAPSGIDTTFNPRIDKKIGDETLLFPNWDTLTNPLLAANLRKEGIDARVLEESPELIHQSMQINNGQCLPVSIIAQETIEYVRRRGNNDPVQRVRQDCLERLYPQVVQGGPVPHVAAEPLPAEGHRSGGETFLLTLQGVFFRNEFSRKQGGESMENILKIFPILREHPDTALFVKAVPSYCCPAMITEAMNRDIERITGVPAVSITYDGTGATQNDKIIPYLLYRSGSDETILYREHTGVFRSKQHTIRLKICYLRKIRPHKLDFFRDINIFISIMDTRELYTTASLAHLSLSDEEARELSQQVSRMLEYFSLMRDIDVDSLEPTTHAFSKANRLRQDTEVNGERLSHVADSLLDNAPELEDRFFVIPNVL